MGELFPNFFKDWERLSNCLLDIFGRGWAVQAVLGSASNEAAPIVAQALRREQRNRRRPAP
jgi:hypothetical protein